MNSFKEKIWLDNEESAEALRNSLTLLKNWRDCVRQFTAQIWPQNALNKWNGKPLSMSADFDSFDELIEKVIILLFVKKLNNFKILLF